MALKDTIKEKWDALDAKKRQNAVRAGIAAVGIVAIFGAYFVTGQQKKIPVPPKQVNVISVGENRLEDDVRAQVEKQRQADEAQKKETDAKLQVQDKTIEQAQAELKLIQSTLDGVKDGKSLPEGDALGGNGKPPQWPDSWNGSQPRPAGMPVNGQPVAPIEPELIGDIGSTAGTPAKDDGKKKGGKKFYLPVSFMSAHLLTGLKAKTVETARNDPEPMLFRVQAPAVLPNEVRAELSGCLVVANGFGSLASERIEAKLVSLNCYDYDNNSIIDADLKGIIVDKDGVKGLAGHVVMKAGANMARAMVAGAFQGAGQVLSQSSQTVSTSPLGATQTIQPNQVGQAALGQGLASGAGEMAKVYLDLVKQSAPVIEHGPDTDCTVVVTEGVWLEVKDSEQN